jgi:drug/metabolite transporter (DMT)-like permease
MPTAPTSAARTAPVPPLGWALYVGVILIWGASFILIKRGLVAFTPLQVGALRMWVAGTCLAPIALFFLLKKYANKTAAFNPALDRPYPWATLAIVALTGNLLPAVLFPLAQTHLPSSTVGTINSLTPLMTLLIGIIAYGERLRPQALLGIVLGFAGSVSLILMRSSGAGAEFDWVNLGYGGVALISSVCYGISLNVVKRRLPSLRSAEVASLTIAPAGFIGLGYLLTTDFFVRAVAPEALTSLLAVCLLGAMGTAVALLLFYRLVQLTTPLFAASNTYFLPFMALLWGALDGEPVGWIHLVALALILGGVWLVNRKTNR